MRSVSVASAGLGTFVGLVVVQHALRPGLPPAEHFVSEYAVGPGGWIQRVAFAAWAVSLADTARRAVVALPHRRPVLRWAVVVLVATAALGAAFDAACSTVTVGGELPARAVYTTAGRLHDLGATAILLGLVLAALAALGVLRGRGYKLEVAGLAAALVLAPTALVVASYDAPGWGQRAFIAIGCLWQWRLLERLTRDPAAARAPRAGSAPARRSRS